MTGRRAASGGKIALVSHGHEVVAAFERKTISVALGSKEQILRLAVILGSASGRD